MELKQSRIKPAIKISLADGIPEPVKKFKIKINNKILNRKSSLPDIKGVTPRSLSILMPTENDNNVFSHQSSQMLPDVSVAYQTT